jgi:hypothetical protein
MRRLVLYLSLVALAASLLVAGSGPAWAARTCGTRGNWHDGFRKYLTETYTTWGVSAQVRVQVGTVCEGDTSMYNFSNAWTMLSSHAGNGWGQTGFIRWYHHDIVHFAQYKQGPTFNAVTYYGNTSLAAGELHQYWTLRGASSNCLVTSSCLVGHIDQTTWFYTPFDPAAFWSTPFVQLYEGEVGYREANIPGVATAKTGFNYMQYINSSNQWVSSPCNLYTVNDNPNRWTQETVECDWRRIWTKVP